MQNLNEFIKIVDDTNGLYLDCIHGIGLLREQMIKSQIELGKRLKKDVGNLDTELFSYSKKKPLSKNVIHDCTQGEFKIRTERNNKDYIMIGRFCVVIIFNYWEDFYRKEIAKDLGFFNRDELKSDIMGDLHYLRDSIIHHKGIAIQRISKAKIIKWFKEGNEINISSDQFEIIINEIKNDLKRIKIHYPIMSVNKSKNNLSTFKATIL